MAPRNQKMKAQCVNPDRISSLPQNITGHILTSMPIRDAIRTSILSRKWRSGWKSMTRLVFDEKMVKVPSNCQQSKKSKLASAILNVLSIHTGSILEIKIRVGEFDVDSEFDQIIRNLARNNHLQKLCFWASIKQIYKLPSSFFSLRGLESIGLTYCLFKPPISFDGFSKLSVVRFVCVDMTSETLKLFLSKCPLIKDLALKGDFLDFDGENKLTFVELLQCVPLIENLEIRCGYMEYLSAGGMPHKLPTSLVHLRRLFLDAFYNVDAEVSSVLCLMRSSPNLEEFILKIHEELDTSQSSKNDPNFLDFSGISLDHLKLFDMQDFINEDFDKEFLKLIMAKSPMLKRARIELYEHASVEQELEILRDLLILPFPRASPSAKLIIERPKSPS